MVWSTNPPPPLQDGGRRLQVSVPPILHAWKEDDNSTYLGFNKPGQCLSLSNGSRRLNYGYGCAVAIESWVVASTVTGATSWERARYSRSLCSYNGEWGREEKGGFSHTKRTISAPYQHHLISKLQVCISHDLWACVLKLIPKPCIDSLPVTTKECNKCHTGSCHLFTLFHLWEWHQGMIQGSEPELNPGFPKGSSYQPINLTTEPPLVV